MAQNLNQSFSALANALSGKSYNDAFDSQATMLGRMGLFESQIRQNDAQARLLDEKTRAEAAEKTAMLEARAGRRDPARLSETARLRLPNANPDSVNRLVRRGFGAPFAVPADLTSDDLALIGETTAGINSLQFADGKTGGEDIVSTMREASKNAQRRRAPELAATNPHLAAWQLAAANGHDAPKIYSALPGGLGSLDSLTGVLAYDPQMKSADLAKTGAQANQANAAAGASRASATNSYAHADLARAQRGQVGKPLWDSDRGVLIDPASGNARPVMLNGTAIAPKASTGDRAPVGYRWTSDGLQLEPIAGGPADPATKANTGKPLPTSAAQKLMENRQNMRRAEQAQALIRGDAVNGVQGDPDATGLKGYLPDGLLNRLDEKGVSTRAAIADLGSLVIHDRSGAAVTAAEYPRLAPFIPKASDPAEVVQKKLQRFAVEYQGIVEDAEEFYRSSGYNVPADPNGKRGASGSWDGSQTGAPKPGTRIINGRTYVNRNGEWYAQ